MLIDSLYLTIAGLVTLILLFLIAYLIYMLVSEGNRWEDYTDKLKSKIRELIEFKSRFHLVSENIHKQMEITKDLTVKVGQFDSQIEAKDDQISEQENLITELQKFNSELQEIFKGLENKGKQLDESNIALVELKTQIALLEDQGIEIPEQIKELHITVEKLETENHELKLDINNANETISQYRSNLTNNNFNLRIEAVKNPHDEFDQLNDTNDRYEGEIDRLKKNYKNQKHIIDDLEMALNKARNNPSEPIDFDTDSLNKLNQMLIESTTVVEMLEGEIDILQDDMNQLRAQNKALTEAVANSSSNDIVDDTPDVQFSDEEVFEDASLDASRKTINANSNDVFFDTDSPLDSTPPKDEQVVIIPEMEQLQMQLESTNQMAMTMMMTSGDQGNIINFARNSIQFKTLDDLAKGVLETVVLFQVNGALQLRGKEHAPLNISSYGTLTAQDNEKISMTDTNDRFTEDGSELLIQFKNISLLIKDMPLSDNDKLGRIKDNMAIALELASSNLLNIESSLKIKKNEKILSQVLKSTYKTIQNVEQQFNEQNGVTNQVINSLTGIISNPAMTKGMDPIHKDVFTNIINDGKTQFDKIKEAGVAIDGNFSKIVRRLGSRLDL